MGLVGTLNGGYTKAFSALADARETGRMAGRRLPPPSVVAGVNLPGLVIVLFKVYLTKTG